MPVTVTGMNALLSGSLREQPGAFVDLYLALFTVTPTLSGGGTEVDDALTNYERLAFPYTSWGDPSGGVTLYLGAGNWPQATTDWGTVVAYGVMFNNSGFLGETDFLLYDAVSPSYDVLRGDSIYIPGSTISVTLENAP